MDQELKQRMIGASVIIALAVIFVPMLFDGDVEEKHSKNISINIPIEDSNNLEVKKFALDKPVTESIDLPAADVELAVDKKQAVLIPRENIVPIPNTTSSKQTPTVVENTANAVVEQPIDKPVDKPTVTAEVKPKKEVVVEPVKVEETKVKVDKAVVKQAATASPLTESYRVKLGSFSQQGNAEKVKSSLLQKNIKAIVEYNPGLKLYRVWSQEMYRTEASANQYVSAVNKLKLNLGTPKVVSLTANEVDLMASQGQLGWVVQLGSFSDMKNATELRNKVSAAGFKGFVDVIYNNKGKELYRLRVGPLMEKVDAEKTQAEIKSKLKLEGLVKNHELSRIVN